MSRQIIKVTTTLSVVTVSGSMASLLSFEAQCRKESSLDLVNRYNK
jgi:hypothetical protein